MIQSRRRSGATAGGMDRNGRLVAKCGLEKAEFIHRRCRAAEVFPPLIGSVSFRRPGHFPDVNDARTKKVEAVLDVLFQRIDQREHGDNGKYANRHPEQGEDGPEHIGFEGLPGEGEAFADQS